MSLWFERKGKDGKRHLYSVPFDPLILIAVFGVCLAMLLTLTQAVWSFVAG